MTCLVTGGTGFAGSTLVEKLVAGGNPVTVVSSTGRPGALEGLDGLELRTCDLTRPDDVELLVADVRPDRVYHLAARTFVPDAEKDARGYLDANLMGTVHLLDALTRHAPGCRVLAVSTGGVYGAAGKVGHRLHEDEPLRPLDPYGASKAAAEIWSLHKQARSELDVVCVRPFGHIGPRQSKRFVAPGFAHQLGRIRAGEQEPVVEVGNLEAEREFTDVEDMAAGHVAALEKGRAGRIYNLCSGRGVVIRDLLALMLERSGVDADVRPRQERMRPADIPSLVGDPSRASEEIGWEALTSLEESVDRLLARWGARDQAQSG